MVSVKNLPRVLQTLLSDTAEDRARHHQVIRRVRAFTGASLCQTFVFGYLADPDASLSQLCQAAAICHVRVRRQAIDQRLKGAMGTRIAAWLQDLLGLMVQQAIRRDTSVLPLLARFGAVWVEDATVVTLPTDLASAWPGCGGSGRASGAALKVGVRLDLVSGQLQGPLCAAGRTHDLTLAAAHPPLPPGSLYIADLGYFRLPRFQDLADQKVAILSRLKAGTRIVDARGQVWEVPVFLAAQGRAEVDVPVLVGREARFPCRLLARRAPRHVVRARRRKIREERVREGRPPGTDALAHAAWTVVITTAPAATLCLAEAFALLHARWQIELLWKGWKSGGGIAVSRSAQADHVLAELFAKLMGLVIQQWLLCAIGFRPLEHSWVVATTGIRAGIRLVAAAIWTRRGLRSALRLLAQSLSPGTRIAPRRSKPSTFQMLADPRLAP